MKIKKYFWSAGAALLLTLAATGSANAMVTGTSTAMTPNAANAVRANMQLPVFMLNLSNSSSENMGSVTVVIATTTSATSTALATSSFSFIGVAKDPAGNVMLATTTVMGIATSTTINVSGATTTPASGNFYVILDTAGTSTFTDNGWPENASATPQKFVVTMSTSTGVVASSTNASLTGATTTAAFAADIHSQAPVVANIGAMYNATTSVYSISDAHGGGGVDEAGTINIYNSATSTSPIATTTVSQSGQMFVGLGTTYMPSVWLDLNDIAGNATSSRVQLNLSNFKPTVASFYAFTDRIIMNVSGGVNGGEATNCANYQVNGGTLSCGGGPNAPYVNFFGNQIVIRNLNLSGTVNFNITGLVQDASPDQFPLAYATSSAPVSAASVPTVSQLAPAAAPAGATVTITGTNFGVATGTVFFSSGFNPQSGPTAPIAASTTAWSNTSITVTVPAGAQSGPLQVAAANGISSDPGQATFFEALGNAYFELALTASSSPITTSTNMNIFIGDPNGGMHVFYAGDASGTSFNAGTDVYTIPNAPLMGFAWAYDGSGATLPAQGMQFQNTSSSNPQFLIFASSTAYKTSGTITLGSSCSTGYKNQLVAAMALPQGASITNAGPGGVQPAMFVTSTSTCQASYAVALPGPGTYNVQAVLPPGTSAVGLLDPAGQTITVTTSTPTTTANFSFSSANYSIYGQILGVNSSTLPASQYSNLMVFAYQPVAGGQGAVARPDSNGFFRLYATPGAYKVSVGGPEMPSDIEQDILVTTSTAFAANASTPVIAFTLTPPTSYIQGYVKDGSGNAISGADIFASCSNGPGNGHSATDNQGYYKMYVPACASYTVNGFSNLYGQLSTQTGVSVSNGANATANFTVNTANLVTVSGSVSQNGSPVVGANVWITQGSFGQGVAGGQTGANGTFSLFLPSGLQNLYVNAATLSGGQLASQSLNSGGVVSSNQTGISLSSNVATLTIYLSPGNTFSPVFLNAQSAIGNGFTNTAIATSSSYDTYQIQAPYSGGGTVYTIGGGIPNFGPIPNSTTSVSGNATITINLGSVNYYTVSGTVSGDYDGSYVWAAGQNGGGTRVASDGTFSMQLRQGTYDIGVNKPGDSGSFLAQQSIATTTSGLSLTLTQATSTISGAASYNGTALVGARVWADNASGGWAGGQTDASGNFSFSVAPGTWRVHAVADGYQLTNPLIVTAPVSGLTLGLSSVSFTPVQQVQSISPSSGGIVQTTSTQVQIPQGALGTGSVNVQLSVTNTMSTPQKKGATVIGTGENISAAYASGANQGQAVSTLSQNATLSFVLTKAQLVAGGVTSLAQAQQMQIGYDDLTSNAWTYIPTTVTASSSDGTWANLTSITLSGTTSHFSTYAPVLPTGANAPATPGGVSASAGNNQITISWTAVSGAANYNVYRENGSNYVYLAQTSGTSYTDTGLSNGVTYSYEVTSLDNSNNESAASGAVSAIPVGAAGGGGGARIVSVATLAAINAANGTVISGLGLPATLVVTSNQGSTSTAQVAWDGGAPAYNPSAAGTYVFTGTLTAPGGWANSNNLTASVNVIVAAAGAAATGASSGGGASGGGGYAAPVSLPATATTTAATTTVVSRASGSSATLHALQAQLLAQLIAELQILLSQAEAQGIALPAGAAQFVSGTAPANGASFVKNLKLGSEGEDVLRLQVYLNTHGFKVAVKGAGSPGHETTRFGTATRKALAAFQKSVGISPALGYFGPKTRAYIESH